MAGSQQYSSYTFQDPILAARLEALQLLADRMSHRVMVVDRDFTVIYANQSAWEGNEGVQAPERTAKCYEAFLQRQDPCELCPATKAFESDSAMTVSCATSEDGARCGMRQAFPLLSSQGTTDCVLVMFSAQRARPHGDSVLANKSASIVNRAHANVAWLGDLIGQSAPMRQLCDMVRLVADSQATVLLHGESGTGKELVARTIHQLSYRRSQPFVVVDCGSIPETLLESELFGHVKGAFTGAVSSKKGLFEEADGGTIFLDEIVDTSLNFQAKLLRVLQEGEVKAVGSARPTKVDVRVISATNKDVLEQVKGRVFREDLYYRLAVLPLLLPPLRDRREDIPLLVDHFVAAACTRHRKPVSTITPEAMQALTEAPWRGNVRELQHMIERAVVTAAGSMLTAENFFGPTPPATATPDLRRVATEAKSTAERSRIVEALRQATGNKAEAARILKISRASLYNKLRAYGIK